MGTIVDIIIALLALIGIIIGTKRGLIKSLVSFVGLIAVIIISYVLRGYVATFLLEKAPFFQFDGSLNGLTSLNIIIYNAIAFVLLFVVLFGILNTIISLTKFLDTVLKFTIVWIIPSKIGGAVVGFLETWIFVFLVSFVMLQFNTTASIIDNSKFANFVLNNTPIVGKVLNNTKKAALDINTNIKKYNQKELSKKELNEYILKTEIKYNIITREKALALIDSGKLNIDKNVLE